MNCGKTLYLFDMHNQNMIAMWINMALADMMPYPVVPLLNSEKR